MTAKASLQNSENPNESHHVSDHTMVYIDLKERGFQNCAEIYQIGAHFAEKSFSRHMCSYGTFGEKTAKQTELPKKACIRYLGGELVIIVSKMDAWKDFVNFLQSANNSVVLVIHNRHRFYNLLLHDLSELSLMDEFRKVCAGIIDTLPLFRCVFPGRKQPGKKYKLKELVKDELGEKNSSDNATVDAVNLEKLMNHANVQPELFQQHFFTISDLEYKCHMNRERILKKPAKRAAPARMTSSDFMESEEDSNASLLSGRVKARNQKDNSKKTNAVTPDVSKQVAANRMTAKNSLLSSDNPGEDHQFSKHTLVYFDLEATGFGRSSEVCQIGAHFVEKSFSKYVCPEGTISKTVAKLTGLYNTNGILYLEGEQIETLSKMDAWKDFLKFLQSANNSVVLVIHDEHSECFLLFRDLSELSLMEEFKDVCAGVIDTFPLFPDIFPGREEIGNAVVDAINLEKLMKHANVQPEIFQQHFFSLSILEYWYQINSQAMLLRKNFPLMSLGLLQKMTEAEITHNDLVRSYIEGGGDSIGSLLSHRMKITDPEAIREIIIAVTPVLEQQLGGRQQSTNHYVLPHLCEKGLTEKMAGITNNDLERSYVEDAEDGSELHLSGRMKITDPKAVGEKIVAITPVLEQPFAGPDLQGDHRQLPGRYVPPHIRDKAKKMTIKDSLQNNENRNGSCHLSDHTLVYTDWKVRGSGICTEIYQIGAHFAENSFARHVCPSGSFRKKAAKQTELSKKDGGEEQVETVSKMDAWKDFLKFLQSANNSVVLVRHCKLNGNFILFRDLSELSLMDVFRRVCVGVINTRPLCRRVFRGRKELGKNYQLKELVKDELGEEHSTDNATVDAINLEKLINHANVEPKIFQQHFFSLANLENRCRLKIRRLLRKEKERAARGRMTCSDNKSISMGIGEDSSVPLLSGRVKARHSEADRKKTSATTPDISKQVAGKRMRAKNSLLRNDNPNEDHQFSKHTLVYFDLEATGFGRSSEVCQIGAHFVEKSFSKYVCPEGTISKTVAKLTGLYNTNGILYLEGEQIETLSKMDAWKDFLKFLQSANNSVVLVIRDRHNECFLLFRDLSELSLMEEFKDICAGVIDTFPLFPDIFPGREEIGNPIVDAINLEKLMKHVGVQPEIFQRHFFSHSILEYWYQINSQALLLSKNFPSMSSEMLKKMIEAEITYYDLVRSYVESGEYGIASLLSRRMKITDPKYIREIIIAITLVLEHQFVGLDFQGGHLQSTNRDVLPHLCKKANRMTTDDSLQNNLKPGGSRHLFEHTLVYFDLEATGFENSSEVCQIGAHFMEKSFSKYVCPKGPIAKKVAKLSRLSKKHGILYCAGKRIETVSKMDAWKDFLKFLQSANNSVVLVIHDWRNECFLLFRDLSELSLIEEFGKVCAGVIDTLPLCRNIFPGREEVGKNYNLKKLVQDNLGKEISASSRSAIVDAINLEKLMKHANVQPEIFQQHFFSLSKLEYLYHINRQTVLLRNNFRMSFGLTKEMVEAGITYDGLVRSYVAGGEDGIASFVSHKMKITDTKAIGEKITAITLVLEQQFAGLDLQSSHQRSTDRYVPPHLRNKVPASKMTTKDSLQNNVNSSGSPHFSEHKLVYFVLEATQMVGDPEVYKIGAYFMEKIFLRFVCPIGTFTKGESKRTGLSKKDSNLYLRGERVVTVSKMDAWKDFLTFLQSANDRVVLVMHDEHDECFLLFRDLSELSLMEEFRKVCVGVIDTLPLCRNIFPGREKIFKNYTLKELVQDNLGKETSEHSLSPIAKAVNLEKLMKHANVQPEIFQHHFFFLSIVEYLCQIEREARLLKRMFPFMERRMARTMAEAGITCSDLGRIYVESGEGGIASFLSGRMKKMARGAIRKMTIAITQILSSELDL